MVSLYDSGIYLVNGTEIVPESESGKVKKLTGRDADQASARKGTIAYSILEAHNTSGDMEHLKLRFDSMASHDITFVGIVQTAKASGMETFPIPYVLTNCHNTLCAVEGPSMRMTTCSACLRLRNMGASMFLRILRSFIST